MYLWSVVDSWMYAASLSYLIVRLTITDLYKIKYNTKVYFVVEATGP